MPTHICEMTYMKDNNAMICKLEDMRIIFEYNKKLYISITS